MAIPAVPGSTLLGKFKCMFTAATYSANDLPRTGIPEKEEKVTVLKVVGLRS